MHIERDTTRWAQQMFGNCELGDSRRTQRLVDVAGRMASHAGDSLLSACRGDSAANEGAYRLIRNASVAPQAIAEGGFERVAEEALEYDELLAVEDTTSLAYGHKVTRELGDLGGPERSVKRGFHVHSVLLVDADSTGTVGLIEQSRWCRSSATRGQRRSRVERAYESKESFKWQRASQRVSQRLGETMARVISVCDREADVYEYLRYKRGAGERFIVRATWDRRIQGEQRYLYEAVEGAALLGRHTVNVVQRGGRRARCAQLELRAATVTLQAPKRTRGLGPLELNVVLAQEVDPPQGETPLRWLLLTSEPIGSVAQVRRVLRYYQLRWRVEDFHKAWKSGAGVEQRRMHSADNLERMVVILGFIAVRLLQLREVFVPPSWLSDDEQAHAANERRAQGPCTEVLSREEWQVLWVAQERSRPPVEPPTLRWAYESLGKLGGWIDTKRTGRIGWQTMWKGWFRLQERLDTYLAMRDLHDAPQM